jgi:uncharacterized surface anchored protein
MLLVLPVLLLMAFALATPVAAVAASETTSGYNQKPKEPTTGTSPSKEEKSAPASKESEPSKTSSTTAPSTGSEKASTLPFTGLDLRWTFAIGVLLIGAGFSIVVVQRRARRNSS